MAIVLEKIGDMHRLQLDSSTDKTQNIKIALDWKGSTGFLHRLFGASVIDLDLGCYYELNDGKKMLIDSLQFGNDPEGDPNKVTRQGCLTQPPYIWHTGDDRGTGRTSREIIVVNPRHIDSIRRMIIYAYIYEGDTRWSSANGLLTVCVPGCDVVAIKIDQQNLEKRFCAIASLHFYPDGVIEVQKLLSYYKGHSDCDHAYGWGFKYQEKKK